HLTEAAREREGAWRLLLDFQRAASETRGIFGAPISGASNEAEWVEDTDASVFHLAEWDSAIRDAATDDAWRKLRAAREALARLLGKDGLNRAPRGYVAVLAMDGDSMGEWVSGAKSPAWRTQLANEAVEYFNRTHAGAHSPDALQRLLDAPRHVSPSYHLQLSEALANFALYLAGPIVEHFDGQLIYAGGDDLLAMLPAEKALDCAQTLRMAFRGDPKLDDKFPGVLRAADQQWGFVAINGEWDGWERWQRRFLKRGYHLLVPGGRADISAGIAIGHMHSPLQNLVEA